MHVDDQCIRLVERGRNAKTDEEQENLRRGNVQAVFDCPPERDESGGADTMTWDYN